MPSTRDLRICALWAWKPHFCRPVLEPFHPSNPAWKAQISDAAALLKDPDYMVRGRVGYVLGIAASLPYIATMLKDSNPNVRAMGMEAVEGKGGMETLAGFLAVSWPDEYSSVSPFFESLAGMKFSCDDAGVQAARAWWAQHKNDPEFVPKQEDPPP